MASWWDVFQAVVDGISMRAVVIVADPRPLNGDLAEDRLECEGPCPPPPDAGAAFAVPVLENQFLIGLLDQDLEEPALDLETGLMNARLDWSGRCSSCCTSGQAHLQRQSEGEA